MPPSTQPACHWVRKSLWVFALALTGWIGASPSGRAAETNVVAGEYQVKAAFLYNLTKFAEWPEASFTAPGAPLIIGIVGDDPFGTVLDDIIRGEMVGTHPLLIQRLKADQEGGDCQLLFFSRSENKSFLKQLSQLRGKPALTVSDIDQFAEQGGMINLHLIGKSVKIEVNPGAAEKAGLKLRAKLLSLARKVDPATHD
jgi:YfiR/HmsC-like